MSVKVACGLVPKSWALPLKSAFCTARVVVVPAFTGLGAPLGCSVRRSSNHAVGAGARSVAEHAIALMLALAAVGRWLADAKPLGQIQHEHPQLDLLLIAVGGIVLACWAAVNTVSVFRASLPTGGR